MTSFNQTTSDELSSLRKLFSEDGLFASFGNLFQINLILDANAILKDIRWLACKAKNPNARTSLIEAIDAKTIIAFAPTFLEEEIQKNIPLIAEEEGIEAHLFFKKWEQIKTKINFIESGGPDSQGHDPKDVPYVKLHNEMGYPILSNDSDISKMGAKAIKVELMVYARDYSREAAVEYKLKAGFLGVFVITSSMISVVSDFIRSLKPSIQKIPPWAWLLVLVSIILLLANEGFKNWLTMKVRGLSEQAKENGIKLIEMLEPIILEHQNRQLKANQNKNDLIEKIK